MPDGRTMPPIGTLVAPIAAIARGAKICAIRLNAISRRVTPQSALVVGRFRSHLLWAIALMITA